MNLWKFLKLVFTPKPERMTMHYKITEDAVLKALPVHVMPDHRLKYIPSAWQRVFKPAGCVGLGMAGTGMGQL